MRPVMVNNDGNDDITCVFLSVFITRKDDIMDYSLIVTILMALCLKKTKQKKADEDVCKGHEKVLPMKLLHSLSPSWWCATIPMQLLVLTLALFWF